MKYVNILETDMSLKAIIDEVTNKQSEVVITHNGLPLARIVPCLMTNIKNYPLRGKPITIADDFDEAMPEQKYPQIL